MQLMQSKHDVIKIVDDVLTLTLMSIYHCSEKNMKKERLKFSKLHYKNTSMIYIDFS